MILRPVPVASFKSLGFLFEDRVNLWVSINHPKPILKELFNLQLRSPTSFLHEKVLSHLPLFSFLRIICFYVLLSALVRTRFPRNKNIIP